jgi:hypothetical protein
MTETTCPVSSCRTPFFGRLTRSFVLALWAASVVTLGACNSTTNGDDDDNDTAGNDAGETDVAIGTDSADGGPGGNDAGETDAGTDGTDGGSGIKQCAASTECKAGQYCDPETRFCAASFPCSQDSDCLSVDYPSIDVIACVAGGEGKVCKPKRPICAACLEDADCGNEGDACLSYGDGKFCGKKCGSCPAGFLCTDGQCKPVDGSCSGAKLCQNDSECDGKKCTQIPGTDGLKVCANFCTNDSECDRSKSEVCNAKTGYCIKRCSLIDGDGGLDCPPGQACQFNGQCGAPCSADTDCASYAASYPGKKFRCEEGSCRIDGCVIDGECPFPGYCDTDKNECILDKCRTNKDCSSGKLCVDPGFLGAPTQDSCTTPPCECRQEPCTNKGAFIACNRFQYCCGEDTARACPSGVATGQCYKAPSPPFCVECDPNAQDACPTAQGFDGRCYQLQDQQQQPIGNFCGVGCTENKDCPAGMACKKGQDQNGGEFFFCDLNGCPKFNQGTTPPAPSTP